MIDNYTNLSIGSRTGLRKGIGVANEITSSIVRSKDPSRYWLMGLLLIVCMMMPAVTAFGQTVVVGSGASSTSGVNGTPIYRSSAGSSFNFSQSAHLYSPTQLTTAGLPAFGTITSFGFYKNDTQTLSAGRTATLRVYMKNTSATTMVTSQNFATWITGATLVYENTSLSSSFFPAVTGLVPINLTTPFVYTGSSLEIYVDWAINSGTGNPTTGSFSWTYDGAPAVQNVGTSNSVAITGALSTSNSRTYRTSFTYTPPAPCSGVPAPGNTIASNTTPCAGSVVSFSLQNLTVGSGVSYQWYNTSGLIPGANSANYSTAIQMASSYYCQVTCDGNTTASSPVAVSPTVISSLPWNEGFEGVTTGSTTVGTSTNLPSCWNSQDTRWSTTSDVTYNVARGGTKYLRYAWSTTNAYMWSPGFQLTAGLAYDYSFYAAGDGGTGWNNDVFVNSSQSSTGATQLTPTYTAPGSGSISIQPYAKVTRRFIPSVSGVYYFAIRGNQSSSAPWYMAFDDFSLVQVPLCSGTPNNGAITISQTSGCSGGSLSFTSSGLSIGDGITYQWQSSTTNSEPWNNVGTGETYSATSVPGTTYYRLATICSLSSTTSYSNVVSFNGIACGSVNLPASGESLVDCGTSTFIYDSGGPSGDYAVNTGTGYVILDNSGTGVITLTGNVLGMESCCDDIFIYAGAGTGGTLLANYTSAGAITPIVSAPGQPITIAFFSDVSVVGAGFAFQALYSGTCLTCDTPIGGTATAATATYCNSGSTTISATGYTTGTGTRYQWESSTDNFATAGVPIGSVVNNYANLATGNLTTTTYYRLRVFCNANPGGAVYSSVASVTINFPGTIAPITGANICATQSATLTATSAGAVSFSWTGPGGYTASGNSITVNPSVTSTYTVTATYANNCTATATGTVIIQDTPSAISVTPDGLINSTVCNGSSVKLNATGGNYNSTYFADNFDAASAQFTVNNASSSLNTTYQTQGSGSVLYKTDAFSATSTYSLNTNVNLVGATTATLSFSHIAALEGAFSTFDYGYVEYSTDGGTNWTTFTSANYSGTASTSLFNGNDVRFSTLSYSDWSATLTAGDALPNNSLWKTESFTIPAGALTNQFRIRFRTTTDSSVTYYGWLIDDLKISANGNVQYAWNTTPATTLYTDAALSNVYNPATDFAPTVYAQPTVATQFTANVSSGTCSNSGSATVNVNELPSFSVNPITICGGTTGTLTAISGGSNSYSWTPVGGGATLTGASVNVSPLATTTYNVTATSNTTIPACSNTIQVTVTVNDPGTIVSGTTTRTVSPGQVTTFEVVTTGLVTYQWQVNDNVNGWQNILAADPNYTGETSDILHVDNITLSFDTYQYRCLVTGLAPCATLAPIEAVLNVTNTGFSTQPASVNLCGTSSTSFSIVTTGDEPYNVQWQISTDGGLNFTDIVDGFDGATGLTFSGANDFSPKTLTVSGITPANDNYKFKCQLDFFLDSSIATLNVNTPVAIVNNVSATTVNVCKVTTVTPFSIATSGSVAGVQWKYATSPAGPWNALAAGTPAGASYSGANTNNLSVTTTAATPVGLYYYKAFITGAGSGPNKCPDLESNVATISMGSPTITVSRSAASYCTPGAAVVLTAGGSDINNYSWSTSETGTSINVSPTASTTYTVTGTDSNGCINTAQTTIGVGSSFTVAATATPATVCPGAAVTLGATSTPISGAAYLINTTPYQFTSASGTFTPVSGAGISTALSTEDDTMSATLTPGSGFTFNYGGTNYTTFRASSNGQLVFGGSGTQSATNSLSTTTTTQRPGLAPLWDDLQLTAGIKYQLTGTAPNRVLIVEWLNMEWNYLSTNPVISFQVKLYESTNVIEYIYRQEAWPYSTATPDNLSVNNTGGASIGLMGTASGNYISLQDTSGSPVVSNSTAKNDITTKPATGQIYRFTPVAPVTYTYAWSSTPAGFSGTGASTTANPTVTSTYTAAATSSQGCTAQGTSPTVTVNSAPAVVTPLASTLVLCQGATATFTVTATSATALTYQWLKDGSPLTNGTGISGATTATLTLTGITLASAGNYSVNVTNCSTVTSNATALTVNPLSTATISGTTSVCQIDSPQPTVTFTGAVGTAPYTFTYKINGGADLTVVSDGAGIATVSAPVTTAGIFTYTLVSIKDSSSTLCSNAVSGSATITVKQKPTAVTVAPASPSICQGGSVNLTATGGTTGGAASGTIGTGTSLTSATAQPTAFCNRWPSYRMQTVYTAAELSAAGLSAGNITSMAFNITTLGDGATNSGFTVKISTIATSTLSGSFVSTASGFTTVYGPQTYTHTASGWQVIPFSTPYVWNGTSNIIVDVVMNGADSINNSVTLYTPTAGTTVAYTTTNASNAASFSSNRLNVQFGYNSLTNPTITWSPTIGLSPTTGTTVTATPAVGVNNYTATATVAGCSTVSNVAAVTVNPTPTAVAPANQLYYNGLATAAIPLSGTPSGVTFDISGGAAIGLANATGITTIPSFIPATGSATVTITPKANNCTGASVSYNIVVSAVNTNPIANQSYCEGATTSAIPLTASPASLLTDVGVTFNITGGASVGLADVTGVSAIPSFVPTPGSATIFVYPVYGGVIGGFATATITVNPLPTATISGSTAVCQNDTAPLVTFTGATGTAPYTFTYRFNGGGYQTIVSSGNTATIAQPTGTAGTFTYTLVSVQDSSSTTCSNAQSGTVTIIVHPTPTVNAVANQNYYSGFPTAAIPLTGTPSGVTFNISGGAASGLADVNGVTAIPSFIPTATPSTVTITPFANGCYGNPITYQIAFNPVVVNITSNVCGSINNGLNNQINCSQVSVFGYTVTGYQFEITNTDTGVVSIVQSSQHHFKLTDADNYAYGTTFTIRVAAILNGNVQGYYGSTCSLTTASVATTKVVTAQCGATLLFVNSTINANAVSSTNLYRFRVSLASAPTTYYYIERTVPNFKLTDVVGLPILFNTEYRVDVQIRVKLAGFEAWSQYGQRCSVFTPAAPETSLVASQCEDYLVPSNTSPINAIAFPGATAYRFRLTSYDEFGDINYQQTVTNATASFTLSQFSGLTPGATYTVAVALELFGTFTDYAKDCSIITPAASKQVTAEPFKATAYPNPFAANFMIDVKTTSTSVIAIKVYDMVGRLVEQKSVTVADLGTSPIGNNYPSGVYNVVVTQDETVQTVRVVKR